MPAKTFISTLDDIPFPENLRYQAQIYYGSIGWAAAASLGAEVARREIDGEKGRLVLVTGDGSMALTIQEVGTMIKAGLKLVIFVLNNEGYTVERLIWGAHQCTPSSSSSSPSLRHLTPNPYPYPCPLLTINPYSIQRHCPDKLRTSPSTLSPPNTNHFLPSRPNKNRVLIHTGQTRAPEPAKPAAGRGCTG